MRTTVDLPEDLAREVKLRASEENRKLKDVLADLLRRGLAGGQSVPIRSETSSDSLAEVLLDDNRTFLDLRGSFKVGPGDPVEDVRKARRRMGTERA
jgi:plasmid stability protein